MNIYSLPVLMYHSVATISGSLGDLGVAPQLLEEQLSTLTGAGYTLVGVTEALARRSEGDRGLLAGLTFDDGYSTFAAAIPVLRSLGARATLYVCPGYVGRFPEWLGRSARKLGSLMDWSELDEVSSYGVEIGNHSLDHIPLDILPTSDVLLQLQRSRESIGEHLGKHPVSFCYPHGYHSPRVRKAVEKTGHVNACAIGHAVSDLTDTLRITRLMVRPSYSGDQLIALLSAKRSWKSRTKATLYPAWRLVRTAEYVGMGRVMT